MNPIYKFELTANETTRRVYPIYGADLAKEFNKESAQEFFRAKLAGNLTFEREDYAYITNCAFDTKFRIEIFISYNAGQTWSSYWQGQFYKTDCTFDADAQTVEVNPSILDRYTAVLAGLDKEYNLIDLMPVIAPIKADKRPMTQIYVPGETTIGCFLSGMWWEQECEAVTDPAELTNTFKFGLKETFRIIEISGNTYPPLPGAIIGAAPTTTDYTITQGNYRFEFARSTYGSNQYEETYKIYFDNILSFSADLIVNNPSTIPTTVYLSAVASASGSARLVIRDTSVYGRLIMDVPQWGGVDFPPIPANDIVDNNRNYHYVCPFTQFEIAFSSELWDVPTQWGIYEPGKYYQCPDFDNEYYPVGRSAWGATSLWLKSRVWPAEAEYRKAITIKDTYPIYSVISVLLGQIAPDITHDGTTAYSQFLYGTNIIGVKQALIIAPKSNVIAAGYDQPAQKAMITLRNVLEMLRDCFRCFWFIDEDNRLRIEHIEFFRRGGSYSDNPVVGIDLVTQQVTRNGKAWAFARNQYKFEKPEMAARYQFAWMDDCTQLFNGYPIDIISQYVNPENVQQIDVPKFSSDVDYILLNPSAISKDGFVLMAGVSEELVPNTIAVNGQSTLQGASFNFDLTPYKGKKMRVKITADRNRMTLWQTGTEQPTSIGMLEEANEYYTFEFTVIGSGLGISGWGSDTAFYSRINSLMVMEYSLPYYNFPSLNADHFLQNGYLAFAFLQQYYAYDMPAWDYKINGETKTAFGVKRLKTQTLNFPALNDPDLVQLIRTYMGDGQIAKLALNLSSRNAAVTLNFDTESEYDPPVPGAEYSLELGASSYAFGAGGGSYDLVVYGITTVDGVEVGRVQLNASQLAIVQSGTAPIVRNNLTFTANNLGTTEMPQTTATWAISWNNHTGATATFTTTQQANEKTITGQVTTYTPEERGLIWEESESNIARGSSDYARFAPGLYVVVTENYEYTSGISGSREISNTLDRDLAVLSIVAGTGLSIQEVGSGLNRYYHVEWAQNNSGAQRQGTLRLAYDGQTWDYTVTQAAYAAVLTYALRLVPQTYLFPKTGGSLTVQVEGVTYTDGVETFREYVTASELSFASSGDAVATRSGLTFTAADISALQQAEKTQNWTLTWNTHPTATQVLILGQEANLMEFPEWITITGDANVFYLDDADVVQGWIKYVGPDTVYIYTESDNEYLGVEVFNDPGMTQADVIGTVGSVGPLTPFNS